MVARLHRFAPRARASDHWARPPIRARGRRSDPVRPSLRRRFRCPRRSDRRLPADRLRIRARLSVPSSRTHLRATRAGWLRALRRRGRWQRACHGALRSTCTFPMAQPARHRERAGNFRLPAVQGWGAVHLNPGLSHHLDECRGSQQEQCGCGKDQARKLNVFRTPPDILEDADALVAWATTSTDAALSGKARKTGKHRKQAFDGAARMPGLPGMDDLADWSTGRWGCRKRSRAFVHP